MLWFLLQDYLFFLEFSKGCAANRRLKMSGRMRVTKAYGREVLDSRGFPTVEVELELEEMHLGRAVVPSGASTGEGEALELRDGDQKRFLGKGVLTAVENVNEKIAPAIVGREFTDQTALDDLLLELDGTPNKSRLGANALLAVSMAFCRASSLMMGVPTYRYISTLMGEKGNVLPVPLMNIINGGQHADNELDLQEFMIAPVGFDSFKEALRAGVEVFHHLKKILTAKGVSTSVGDEGGFAPNFPGDKPHEQALNAIVQAISEAGYKPGRDIFLALDAASSEFIDKESSTSNEEVHYLLEGKRLTGQELIEIYRQWSESYPILSIEDGLSEHDWAGWKAMTEKMSQTCQLVGDDLFVTNPVFLKKGIDEGVGNSILIKLNQIGTVTETLETMKMASQAKYSAIASHRSGETEDTFIAHLAVGTSCGQIKTGSASRTDRIAKYNELLRIEEQLGDQAVFAGSGAFGELK